VHRVRKSAMSTSGKKKSSKRKADGSNNSRDKFGHKNKKYDCGGSRDSNGNLLNSQVSLPPSSSASRNSSVMDLTQDPNTDNRQIRRGAKHNLAKPIFVATSESQTIIEFTKKLNLEKTPYFKKSLENTQVICQSLKDKKVVIEALNKSNYQHYTFTETAEKPKIFALKRYDLFSSQEMLARLQENGIAASKVSFLVKTRNPIYLVHFSKDSEMNVNILNDRHRHIDNQLITWDRFDRRRKRLTQCHKCQRFGHAASNCGYDYRCVKCDQQHLPGQCLRKSKEAEGTPKCVNCSGNHPANHIECPTHKEYNSKVDSKRNIRQNITRHVSETRPQHQIQHSGLEASLRNPAPFSTNPALQAHSQRPSFANIVSGGQNGNSSSMFNLISEFNAIPKISETMQKFANLVNALKACPDTNQHLSIIIQHTLLQNVN
jgi:hypothetical protein